MTWQTFAFLIVAGAAFSYSGYRFSLLYKLMKAQQGHGPKLDRIPARIGATLANVLGQKAVLRKKYIGLAHTMIFWGFIIITVGTLEQFISTIYKDANLQFIGETAYKGLAFLQDCSSSSWAWPWPATGGTSCGLREWASRVTPISCWSSRVRSWWRSSS
jgi:hypothetical protein